VLVYSTLAAVALCASLPVAAAMAQRSPGSESPGSIAGRVIDAESGRPIENAVVTLHPSRGSIGIAGRASRLQVLRSTRTDSLGRYRFVDLRGGSYDMQVQRVGYRRAEIGIDLTAGDATQLSVGLAVAPVLLVSVNTSAQSVASYGRTAIDSVGGSDSRIQAARARQQQYLATDVREVTHADVLESVTLGETDVFRALQQLPGVSGRDEYGAELWIRGARWDLTRVYLDDLRLLQPLHALGGFSGVNADAIGAALLHPGVRPASLDGGSAAVIELHSRVGNTDRSRGIGELSVASSRMAFDGSVRDGKTLWMVAARRSYLDLLTSAISRATGDPSIRVPYAFSGFNARLDHQLAAAHVLEASVIHERDRVAGDIPDFTSRNRAVWGNSGARASLVSRFGEWRVRHTVGASRFVTNVDVVDPSAFPDSQFTATTEPPLSLSVTQLTMAGGFERETTTRTSLSFGYDLRSIQSHFDGSIAYVRTGQLPSDQTSRFTRTMTYGSLWIDHRALSFGRLEIESGLRVDAGRSIRAGGSVRAQPRVLARLRADSSTMVSLGLGRSIEYLQTSWRSDRLLYSNVLPIRNWLVAGPTVPALNTDHATVGVERWLGPRTLLTGNAYVRRSHDMTMPDPRAGSLVDRDDFVLATERAHGVEVGVRRLSGRITGSTSLSYNRATTRASGLTFVAPSSRPWVFDVTARTNLAKRLSVGAAFVATSTARSTRILEGSANGDADSGEWLQIPIAGNPSAEISGSIRSLDLMAEWRFGIRRAQLTAFVQVINSTGRRRNSSLYRGFALRDGPCTDVSLASCGGEDEFLRGLPRLPLLGLRAAF
jgi:hypothetical protein